MGAAEEAVAVLTSESGVIRSVTPCSNSSVPNGGGFFASYRGRGIGKRWAVTQDLRWQWGFFRQRQFRNEHNGESAACMRLLQLGILRSGFFHDGDVAIGVFPQGEEVLVSSASLGPK